MPELPEVEVSARMVRDSRLLTPVTTVTGTFPCRVFHGCDPTYLQERLRGRVIRAIKRHGKYLLLEFDDDAVLILHRGMSGDLIVRRGTDPSDPYTRLTLSFDDGRALDFTNPRLFGRIVYFARACDAEAYLAQRLGPDALSPIDGSFLERVFGARRAPIKTLLLDQHLLAGVGNLYADESLWLVQIHPTTPGDRITREGYAALASTIPALFRDAIRLGATTPAHASPGEASILGADERFQLHVYGRRGEQCDRCGTPIERIILGGRGTYFCPTCQRRAEN